MEEELRHLKDDVRVRGREIDALQAIDTRKPWYRQATTVVALGALVVSLLSAVVGFRLQATAESRAESRERVQDRSDLRSILQRLIVLPIDTQELYKDYPAEAAELSKNVTNEYALLTGQAVTIIEQLGRNDNDDVSAAEYNALAGAMLRLPGMHEEARIYFQRAADRAGNLNDHITAIRSIAGIDYAVGSYGAMREQYEQALAITEQYPATPYLRASTDTETYLLWAANEIVSENCAEGQRLLQAAFEAAGTQNVMTVEPSYNVRFESWQTSASRCVSQGGAGATGG